MTLSGKQKRKLRALGHPLEPIVLVGQHGLTSGVISAAEQALSDHELIKVRMGKNEDDRHETAARLAEATGAHLVQVLGRTLLLFRIRKQGSVFPEFTGSSD